MYNLFQKKKKKVLASDKFTFHDFDFVLTNVIGGKEIHHVFWRILIRETNQQSINNKMQL